MLGFRVAGKFPGKGGHNVYFLENPSDGKMYEISQRDQLPGGATTRVDHIAYRSEELETMTQRKIIHIAKSMDIRFSQMRLKSVRISGRKVRDALKLKVRVHSAKCMRILLAPEKLSTI